MTRVEPSMTIIEETFMFQETTRFVKENGFKRLPSREIEMDSFHMLGQVNCSSFYEEYKYLDREETIKKFIMGLNPEQIV